MNRKSIKPALTLLVLFALVWLLPDRTVDPWNVFNPKKMSKMVFALTLIQFAGSFILQLLGSRVGSVLTGFLGGLVSSTATVASLAKRSKHSAHHRDVTSETLIFLAATIAMLAEGVTILLFGTRDVHAPVLVVFLLPAIAAGFLIFLNTKKSAAKIQKIDEGSFDLLPIVKLSGFIIAILSASKILTNLFGKSGLLVLTFIVSLFEIHGSFIANIQLHDSGAFDVQTLGNLAALSVAASYCSKWFLIYTLGSPTLKVQAKRYTFYLLMALGLGWGLFSLVV